MNIQQVYGITLTVQKTAVAVLK